MQQDIEIRLLDTETEQPMALPLLARCFPDYWEQTAARNKRFPFEEISFGAIFKGDIVGHCGIIPYRISNGTGEEYLFGGIASVAVAPEVRGRGIARELCLYVRNWVEGKGYASLPLYTSKARVYESAGWHDYVSTQPRHIVFPAKYANVCSEAKCGSALTDDVRRYFVSLYEKQDFCGKVLRGSTREYLGWKRIFQDPEHSFAWHDGMTAIFYDGALAECFAEDAVSDLEICKFLAQYAKHGTMDCALHKGSRIWQALANEGCVSLPCESNLMHGEHQMALDIPPYSPHSGELIHYSLIDKF